MANSVSQTAQHPHYNAFISYSHQDKAWGDWLHKALESYTLPKPLRADSLISGKNLYPIFRDREELPGSADLGANIEQALSASKALLVICSPRSAKSMWVNQEIIAFQQTNPGCPIVVLLVDGQTDQPEQEDFCLPPALQSQAQPSQAQLTIVDGQPHNKQRRILQLELVALLAGLELKALITANNQRQRRRMLLAITMAIAAAGGSYLVLKTIQQAKDSARSAQQQALLEAAQQAYDSGQTTRALQAVLAAVPEGPEHQQVTPSARTQAMLNTLMQRPAGLLQRLQLPAGGQFIQAWPPTKAHQQQTLIHSSTGGLTMVDTQNFHLLWQQADTQAQQVAINAQGNVLVRTASHLHLYAAADGQLICSTALPDTQAALLAPQQQHWLQKGWVMEVQQAKPADGGYAPVSGIRFVNASTCKATPLRPHPLASHVSLLDVLPDGRMITAADLYDDGQPLVVFWIWPTDLNAEPQPILALPGISKTAIAGSMNAYQYDGPLYLTDPQNNTTLFATQHVDEQGLGYRLSRFSWAERKVLAKRRLASRPQQLWWSATNPQHLLLARQDSERHSQQQVDIFKADDLSIHSRLTKPGNASKLALSVDAKHALSSGMHSTLMDTQLGQQRALTISSSTPLASTDSRWLTPQQALLLANNGQLFSLHINITNQRANIAGQHCCAQWIGSAAANLALDYDNAVWRIPEEGSAATEAKADTDKQPLLIAQGREATLLAVDADRYLIFGYRKSDAETLIKRFDLHNYEQTHELTIPQPLRRIAVFKDHLQFSSNGWTEFRRFTALEQPIRHALDASSEVAVLSKDRQAILSFFAESNTYTDAPAQVVFRSTILGANTASTEQRFPLPFSLLDKAIFLPEQDQLLLIQADEQQQQVWLWTAQTQAPQALGPLVSKHFIGLTPPTAERHGEYLLLSAQQWQGAKHELIHIPSKQHYRLTAHEQLIAPQLHNQQILLGNTQTQTLQVWNLATDQRHSLNCPASPQAGHHIAATKPPLLAIRNANGLCIVETDRWLTLYQDTSGAANGWALAQSTSGMATGALRFLDANTIQSLKHGHQQQSTIRRPLAANLNAARRLQLPAFKPQTEAQADPVNTQQ